MIEKIRRVVMGEPKPGMSTFTHVEEVQPLPLGPTTGRYYVWGCDELPQYPYHQTEPYVPRSHFPPPGGVRVFVEASFGAEPPETEEQRQAVEEAKRLRAAESSATNHGSRPGMHQTDGLDIGIVISGEITVEAEDGSSVTMRPGDIYIQPGAMHLWKTDPKTPAMVAFVILEREDPRPSS
jgi:quercetin dioxygenase-like cupin family protein